jgi:hypothetical protein
MEPQSREGAFLVSARILPTKMALTEKALRHGTWQSLWGNTSGGLRILRDSVFKQDIPFLPQINKFKREKCTIFVALYTNLG